MRTFEALETEFRLTIPCLARVVVVEGLPGDPADTDPETVLATARVRA